MVKVVSHVPRNASGGKTQEGNHKGTDGIKFLTSLAGGKIFYDPGIKLEQAFSDKPRTKRRSQFRVQVGDINGLYEHVEMVDLND